MRLTDHEKAMLDGAHGKAKARAMDLLVRYSEALGGLRIRADYPGNSLRPVIFR